MMGGKTVAAGSATDAEVSHWTDVNLALSRQGDFKLLERKDRGPGCHQPAPSSDPEIADSTYEIQPVAPSNGSRSRTVCDFSAVF